MKKLQNLKSFQKDLLSHKSLDYIRGGLENEKTSLVSQLTAPGNGCTLDVDSSYDDEAGNWYCDRCYLDCLVE